MACIWITGIQQNLQSVAHTPRRRKEIVGLAHADRRWVHMADHRPADLENLVAQRLRRLDSLVKILCRSNWDVLIEECYGRFLQQ